MLRHPHVLLFTADDSEKSFLQHALDEQCLLTPVATLSELISHLENHRYDALFCGRSLQAVARHDALQEAQELHPDLPVITVSETPEWGRLLDGGALDFLVQPEQAVLLLEEDPLPYNPFASAQIRYC